MPSTKSISYLWYNVIGAVVVTVVGLLVSVVVPAGDAPVPLR